MHSKAFEAFGQLFIEYGRDLAITEGNIIVEGRSKAPTDQPVNAVLATLDDTQRAMLRDLVPEITDTVLHYVLLMFEEYDWIKVSLHTEDETITDIRDVAAGGLQGYVSIWAPKYSKQPHSYDQ
jgi:hypothetical protein